MYPEPFEFIGITFIRSYGLLLAVSFLLGVYISMKRAARAGIDQNIVVDLSFIILVAALVGSRLFYVVYHMDEFSDNLLNIINPFQSGYVGIAGLSMMGGVVLAVLSAFLFFLIKKIDPWPVTDAMMPAFALGVGFTRIGCFLNGCCFGLPTDGALGVVFPQDSLAGYVFPGMPLIPTQLYEALAGFVIFFLVLWSERFKKFDGHSFWLTLGLYGAWRFFIDFFRYYEDSMVFASIGNQHISRNQFLSILIVIGSIVAYFVMLSRSRKRAQNHAVKSMA